MNETQRCIRGLHKLNTKELQTVRHSRFDNYRDEGTKSHEHLRRNSIPQGCNVEERILCRLRKIVF